MEDVLGGIIILVAVGGAGWSVMIVSICRLAPSKEVLLENFDFDSSYVHAVSIIG